LKEVVGILLVVVKQQSRKKSGAFKDFSLAITLEATEIRNFPCHD
jgi:hypothetical protein